MLPVLDPEGVRALDAQTLAVQGITSLDLMERAAAACTEHLLTLTPAERPFAVVAGMGNNGGDGLAIARMLHRAGRQVRVLVVKHRDGPSPDQAANRQRAEEEGVRCPDISDIKHVYFYDNEVVIDSILGIGSSRVLDGLLADVVAAINGSGRPVVAIDLPSGLWAGDNDTNDPGRIVRANVVLTLGTPKLSLLLPENAPFVGRWEVLRIGLDEDLLARAPVAYRYMQPVDVAALLRPRPRMGHKGSFGHGLVVAGGAGHIGAAILATRAALRSGCGSVTAHVPAGNGGAMYTAAPEAMCSVDPAPEISELPVMDRFTAIGMGPGLGSAPATALILKRTIQDASASLILDADALNILAENPTWAAFLPSGTLLTPHPKEFDRLWGTPSTSGYERLERARQMATRTGTIIVLKGANTAVCAPDGQVYFNSTGNPGMAKGGSGDVLTGLLTGLLAQGYGPLHAAVLGTHLHGLAGDLAAETFGMDAMKAGDLIDHLPNAWRVLRKISEEPFDGAFPLP